MTVGISQPYRNILSLGYDQSEMKSSNPNNYDARFINGPYAYGFLCFHIVLMYIYVLI